MDKFWGNVQYGIGNYGLVSYSNPQNWGFCIFSVITHRSRAETTENILAILVSLCKLVRVMQEVNCGDLLIFCEAEGCLRLIYFVDLSGELCQMAGWISLVF